MTGAERQSMAEPDEDGKAFGGSAVHYKRSSNTSTPERRRKPPLFFLPFYFFPALSSIGYRLQLSLQITKLQYPGPIYGLIRITIGTDKLTTCLVPYTRRHD